jgi:hypothetical protein
MILEWDITKTEQPGGAWLLERRAVQVRWSGDPEQPDTFEVQRTVASVRREAYTTLANARRTIATELRLDKRVRLRKDNDTHYTYTYTPATFGGEA